MGISPLQIALKRALAVQWYAFGYIVLVTRLERARNKTACYLVASCRCASANSATPEIQLKELKQKNKYTVFINAITGLMRWLFLLSKNTAIYELISQLVAVKRNLE